MKPSWIFHLLLLTLVALFSVQNAEAITVRFAVWKFTTSAALIVLLAAFAGSLVGLAVGAFSRRAARPDASPRSSPPPGSSPSEDSP